MQMIPRQALSRQKQLYNALTDSKSYIMGKPFNPAQIDKSKWTPRNLRRLVIISTHFVLIYHTDSKDTESQMSIVPLIIEKGQNFEKSAKPMITQLYNYYKYSNIEEIVYFTDGYESRQVAEFELRAFNAFVCNRELLHKYFKRLGLVSLVGGFYTDKLLDGYNADLPISEHLKANGLVVNSKKTDIARDAAGNALCYVLNSDYAMESPFVEVKPGSKVVDKQKLAKYFVDKAKAAQVELEKEKEKEKEKEHEKERVVDKVVKPESIDATKKKQFVNDQIAKSKAVQAELEATERKKIADIKQSAASTIPKAAKKEPQSTVKQSTITQGTQTVNAPKKMQTDKQIYNNELKVENNPYKQVHGEGTLAGLNQLSKMSKILLDDISNMVGGLHMVNTFRITHEGRLIIDDIMYQPQFNADFMDSLPHKIKVMVENGAVAELIHMGCIYKFKNLQKLEIDHYKLAQGRCRRELHLHPKGKYSELFKSFRYLHYIKIGDIVYDRGTADAPSELGIPSRPSDYVSRGNVLWDSKPVKWTTNALGWTIGTKAITVAALMFGPWGMLFGGLVAASALGDYKNRGSR